MRKEASHMDTVRRTISYEETDRTPLATFSNIVCVHSAGYREADTRFNPKLSAEVAIRHAKITGTDMVVPALDTNILFKDVKVPREMGLKVPEDNYTAVTSPACASPEEVDQLVLYDPKDPDECPNFTNGIVEKIRALADLADEDWLIRGFTWAPFSLAASLMGADTLLMGTFLDPEPVHKLIAKTTPFCSAIQEANIDAGANMMWAADPTAGEDLISTEDFKRFEFDAIKQVIDDVKSYDRDSFLFLHMCGMTQNTLKCLPDTGLQCFSCDFKTDLRQAFEDLDGRMAMMGNVDPIGIMLQGSPDEVYKTSLKCIDDMPRGLVLSSGCEMPREVPDENIVAMYRACTDYWAKGARPRCRPPASCVLFQWQATAIEHALSEGDDLLAREGFPASLSLMSQT